MPVNARRLIRKMRGGAQSYLIEADDGNHYIVKFRNNPQHRRILVNEWLAGFFLRYLQIAAPATAIIQVNSAFIESNPELCIQLGNTRRPVQAGWHFGSMYPGHPERVAVYDFVPDALLRTVANAADFFGILAFDKWTANADARQSIFIRARLQEYAPAYADHPLRVGFIALMIDHGFIFNGPHWEYIDAPIAGLYYRPSIYSSIRGWDNFQPWLDRIMDFPDVIVDDALRQLPSEWLNGDSESLEILLEKLMNRRKRVPDLIRDSARARASAFSNWK